MLLLLSGERDARLERERCCLFFPILLLIRARWGRGAWCRAHPDDGCVRKGVLGDVWSWGRSLCANVASSRGGMCGSRCPRCLGCASAGVGPPRSHLPCNTGCWCEDAVCEAARFATSAFQAKYFNFLEIPLPPSSCSVPCPVREELRALLPCPLCSSRESPE